MENYKNKRVLIFGLGLLGGGVATANWFLKQGAKVTVTDLKTKEELAPSLKQLKGKVELSLGGHRLADITAADIVVLNPGVPAKHPLIQKALRLAKLAQGKPAVVNEATIFYNQWPGSIIGVTGTRGKTTTATWITHLLGKQAMLAGNSPEHTFLDQVLKIKKQKWAVTEMPSFQTELFDPSIYPELRRPDIAVVTNIYQDHFNRYPSYRAYVKTKANLFAHQTKDQHLILNYDNSWTPFLLTLPRKSKTWFFSLKELPKMLNGVFSKPGEIIFQEGGGQTRVLTTKGFVGKWGQHNVENLMASVLAAHAAGVPWSSVQSRLAKLHGIEFRQQVVYKKNNLTIINDTTATSPEGTIAAVKRFGSPSTILITGGTDRKLEFGVWGKLVANYIVPNNIVMLEGSATVKMIRAMGEFADRVTIAPTLKECLEIALRKAAEFPKATILFSPGSKSFEKFTNEYDRGKQFNKLVKKSLLKQ